MPRLRLVKRAALRPKGRDGVPAYQRIQTSIRTRIQSGRLKPGDAVDSERDLARIHRVSLMTARHALTALEQEGIVERRRGVGTFVAAPKIHINRLMSFTEQMASRSLPGRSRILFAKVIGTEQEIAARLALAPGSSVLKLERLRFASDEPYALETCYLAGGEFAGLASAHLERESLFAVLERSFGVQLGYADEEIEATAADPRTAALLGIARRSPVLRIRQLTYSIQGKATIYMLGFYRSDRHNLVIRRFR